MNYMLTQRQVDFLDKYTVGSWSVNPATGLVDIDGHFIYGANQREVKYPLRGLRFGDVTGRFKFESPRELIDLDGFPNRVGGDFDCSRCRTGSLKGGPTEVGGNYYCSFNDFKNFEYAPEKVYGDFVARFNPKLESFKGLPKYIGGNLILNDGYPWDRELDIDKIKTLAQSNIYGEIELEGLYGKFFETLSKLSIPGVNLSRLLKIIYERGIIEL
jgi:hypothetical protein